MKYVRSAGFWLLCGSLELLLLVHLAEFLYPGYSVSENYISDLGVGPMPSRGIFTAAIIIFGMMSLASAYLMQESNPKSAIWWMIAVSGVGAVGVGIFNEDYMPEVHALFAIMAFLFGNLAAIYSYKLLKPPLSYIAVLLGVLGLSALVLLGSGTYLGLGPGGMERMTFYPAMFWMLGFGAYLMATEDKA